MITRRGFLKGMLAVAVAPAIVKAENIMRVRPLASGLLVPEGRLGTYTPGDGVCRRITSAEQILWTTRPGENHPSIGSIQVYVDRFGEIHTVDNAMLDQIARRTQQLREDLRNG